MKAYPAGVGERLLAGMPYSSCKPADVAQARYIRIRVGERLLADVLPLPPVRKHSAGALHPPQNSVR